MKKYDVYIFDFDGTTFDSRGSMQSIFSYAFMEVGYRAVTKEEAEHFMHQSLPETLEEMKIPHSKLKRFVDAVEEAIDKEETIKQNAPFPETVDVISYLEKEGKGLAIVSGNTVTHISKVLKFHRFPISFKTIIGSDVCRNHHKPEPEPLLMAMACFPYVERSKIVYIGDSLQDMVCASNAGIDGIFIDRNNEFPEYKGITIHSLFELIS